MYCVFVVVCLLPEILSQVPSNVNQFHPCKSLASISETVASPAGSKQSLLRRLSDPLACTCSSVRHVTDMEGTITFIVPELSEKTLMNVSASTWIAFNASVKKCQIDSFWCQFFIWELHYALPYRYINNSIAKCRLHLLNVYIFKLVTKLSCLMFWLLCVVFFAIRSLVVQLLWIVSLMIKIDWFGHATVSMMLIRSCVV